MFMASCDVQLQSKQVAATARVSLVAPEAVWQVWRPSYQSAEIWAVDYQENH